MAKNEMPSRVLTRLRRLIQGYHSEVEELGRVLEALEAAGLVTLSRRKVTRTHDLLERYLEALDAGTFGPREVGKLVAQFENQTLPAYSPDDAFERVKGRAIEQMASVAKRWNALHDVVFDLDVEVPTFEADENDEEDEEDHEAKFLAAVRMVERGETPGALLSVRKVRERADLSKEDFDAVALQLQHEGKLVLHHHDFPASLTRVERDALIQGPKGFYYVGLALPRK